MVYYNVSYWVHPGAWIVHGHHDPTEARKALAAEAGRWAGVTLCMCLRVCVRTSACGRVHKPPHEQAGVAQTALHVLVRHVRVHMW